MAQEIPINLDRIEAAFMSRYWRFEFHTPAECPATLLAGLKQYLPHIESSSWNTRLPWGGVFVNGIEVNDDVALTAPIKLEYYEPKFPIEKAHEFFPTFSTNWIIHEDDDLIVVNKPAGLPSVPGKEQKYYNLRTYIESYLGHRVHAPSRLDMSTSGLVVMSKSVRMHKPLQQAFEGGQVKKWYLCEVEGEVPWIKKTLDVSIGKDTRHPVLMTTNVPGKRSHTIFRRLSISKGFSLLLANPTTGRTHQIRAHAKSLGYPILGDSFYGTTGSGLRLHCFALELPQSLSPNRFVTPPHFSPSWLDVRDMHSLFRSDDLLHSHQYCHT